MKRKNAFPVASRKSDEVEWLMDIKEVKATRAILDHFLIVKGGHIGCKTKTSGRRVACKFKPIAADTAASTVAAKKNL